MSTEGWENDPQYGSKEYPPPWSEPHFDLNEFSDVEEVSRREDAHPVAKFAAALIVGLVVTLVLVAIVKLITYVVGL